MNIGHLNIRDFYSIFIRILFEITYFTIFNEQKHFRENNVHGTFLLEHTQLNYVDKESFISFCFLIKSCAQKLFEDYYIPTFSIEYNSVGFLDETECKVLVNNEVT